MLDKHIEGHETSLTRRLSNRPSQAQMEPCTIGGLHSSPAQAALRCLRGRAKIASAVHGITTSAARRRPGHLGHWLPGEQPTTNLHHTNQPVHDSRLSLGKGMKVRDHWPIMFVPETNQMPHIPSCLTAPCTQNRRSRNAMHIRWKHCLGPETRAWPTYSRPHRALLAGQICTPRLFLKPASGEG